MVRVHLVTHWNARGGGPVLASRPASKTVEKWQRYHVSPFSQCVCVGVHACACACVCVPLRVCELYQLIVSISPGTSTTTSSLFSLKAPLCLYGTRYVRTNYSSGKTTSQIHFFFPLWASGGIAVHRVRSSYRYDKKRGYKSELRILLVFKNVLSHSSPVTWSLMGEFDGAPVAVRGVVHILFESVIW